MTFIPKVWYNIRHNLRKDRYYMNISYHDARHILELRDIPATQKAVLFALLSYMHPATKKIYPTIFNLSLELGCSETTLMRAMKQLVNAGHLEIRKEMFGGRICNNYVIPFSDGYSYNSDQNDPSLPKLSKVPRRVGTEQPGKKPKPTKKPKSANKDVLKDWDSAENYVVYHTSIPSVFVDITFQELIQQKCYDAHGKLITPETFPSHVARMWKYSKHKRFYVRLEEVWNQHWNNIKTGKYKNPDGTPNDELKYKTLNELESEYGLDWRNTDYDSEIRAPELGFSPFYHFYPEKNERRKANNVPDLPLDI